MNSTTEWVTVPREPTEEMVAAGRRYAVPATQAIIPIYVAMISASPVPPSPPRGEIVDALRTARSMLRACGIDDPEGEGAEYQASWDRAMARIDAALSRHEGEP